MAKPSIFSLNYPQAFFKRFFFNNLTTYSYFIRQYNLHVAEIIPFFLRAMLYRLIQGKHMADNSPVEKRAYHVKEAAKAYGWSRSTLYKLMEAGTLRSVKIGGRRLIPRDALEALISEGK